MNLKFHYTILLGLLSKKLTFLLFLKWFLLNRLRQRDRSLSHAIGRLGDGPSINTHCLVPHFHRIELIRVLSALQRFIPRPNLWQHNLYIFLPRDCLVLRNETWLFFPESRWHKVLSSNALVMRRFGFNYLPTLAAFTVNRNTSQSSPHIFLTILTVLFHFPGQFLRQLLHGHICNLILNFGLVFYPYAEDIFIAQIPGAGAEALLQSRVEIGEFVWERGNLRIFIVLNFE